MLEGKYEQHILTLKIRYFLIYSGRVWDPDKNYLSMNYYELDNKKYFQSGINYKHNPTPPWYWILQASDSVKFSFFLKQILVSRADFSGHCNKGAALLCRKPTPEAGHLGMAERSPQANAVCDVPGSPGTCSVWWASGAAAFEVTTRTQGFLKRQGPYTYQGALQNQSSFLISKILFYQPFSRLLISGWIWLPAPVTVGCTWTRQLLQVQSGRPWAFRRVVCCWLVGGRIALSSLNTGDYNTA